MLRCRQILEFGRDTGGLNSPSQKRQNIQAAKILSKRKSIHCATAANITATDRTVSETKDESREKALPGREVFNQEERIFPVEEGEGLIKAYK